MLTDQEFDIWCRHRKLADATRKEIEYIRSSPPERNVGGGSKNVSGFYPSRKMGVTIQFESHRNELSHIYRLETDDDVLEYWDQPSRIELIYESAKGKLNRHPHTPDFFVIRKDSAGFEECKTEETLLELVEKSPNRYQRKEGRWFCPPGDAYAEPRGLYYRLQSSAEINRIEEQNFIYLADYLRGKQADVDEQVVTAILTLIEAEPGLTLSDLLPRIETATIDDYHVLIATNRVFVDLKAVHLKRHEQVKVFLDREAAFTYQQINEIPAPTIVNRIQHVHIESGSDICWDGKPWQIVNVGLTLTTISDPHGAFQSLPNSTFDALLKQGNIVGVQAEQVLAISAEGQEILNRANSKAREEANRRYRAIEPHLKGYASTPPTRTERRYIAKYQSAEMIHGRGYLGLLPNHSSKGNRLPKLDLKVQELLDDFIANKHETPKQQSLVKIYFALKSECERLGLPPPSYETCREAVKKRSKYQQLKKRQGKRSAYSEEALYWQDEEFYPHGQHPFEVCHIDHTQVDLEVKLGSIKPGYGGNLDSINSAIKDKSERPWMTLLTDAYSRRVLAAYVTFDPPSYRSCMMVLQICVERFGRLPQTIVVDNGSDFQSTNFETLLAYFEVTKKNRPPAKARFGAIIERLFGVCNEEFWHNLQGNTQLTKNVRQVTKSFNPKSHAIWSLADVYERFCEYVYEVYDKSPHSALRCSPQEAFDAGIARSGKRSHLQISCAEFRLLSLPSPSPKKRTVQPSGIKIHYFYYWHNAFSQVGVKGSVVEVKYDPFDISVAYAFVKNEWVRCQIRHYPEELKEVTERELKIAIEELRKVRTWQEREFFDVSGKKLAQFLAEVENHEMKLRESLQEARNTVLKQREKDRETRKAYALLEEPIDIAVENPLTEKPTAPDQDHFPALPEPQKPRQDEDIEIETDELLEQWSWQ